MKHFSSAILAFFFIVNFNSLCQEMNPDAGKLYNEGNSLIKSGDFQGAIDKYNKAIDIEKDYRIYYQLGVAQKKAGNLQGAKTSFEECIKLNDKFEGSHNALGGVYFSMGNYSQAITEFEKVLSLTDNGSVTKKVKKNLSLAYTKLSANELANANSVKAIEHLNKAIEYDNYDAAYLSLAQTYTDIGEWDKAITASENAIKYKSKITTGGPYYYMGIAYKGKGDNEKAKEMFMKAKNDSQYKKNAEYQLGLIN
jgi:tetratricopeptide (TPR) repeat protein